MQKIMKVKRNKSLVKKRKRKRPRIKIPLLHQIRLIQVIKSVKKANVVKVVEIPLTTAKEEIQLITAKVEIQLTMEKAQKRKAIAQKKQVAKQNKKILKTMKKIKNSNLIRLRVHSKRLKRHLYQQFQVGSPYPSQSLKMKLQRLSQRSTLVKCLSTEKFNLFLHNQL